MINPFLLSRKKQMVARDLPEKQITVLYCEMEDKQRKIYDYWKEKFREEIKESIDRILSAGIPILGHLGLTPQSINKFGTYVVRAKEEEEAEKLKADAKILEAAGCFGIVLEKIPSPLATEVTKSINIPTIGIGAGQQVDGQVLVSHDMLGINQDFSGRCK